MELQTKLFGDTADEEFRLAQDLVTMAIADGSISKEEYAAIQEISRSEGISMEVIDAYLSGEISALPEDQPMSGTDRAGYLSKRICVMAVDGNCLQMENFLLKVIAGKTGASRMELLSLVLTTTTRKKLKGDTGVWALRSSMKNIIDPKAKNLHENQNNLRAVVNMIRAQPCCGNNPHHSLLT